MAGALDTRLHGLRYQLLDAARYLAGAKVLAARRAALSEARKILRQACHIRAELGDDALAAA